MRAEDCEFVSGSRNNVVIYVFIKRCNLSGGGDGPWVLLLPSHEYGRAIGTRSFIRVLSLQSTSLLTLIVRRTTVAPPLFGLNCSNSLFKPICDCLMLRSISKPSPCRPFFDLSIVHNPEHNHRFSNCFTWLFAPPLLANNPSSSLSSHHSYLPTNPHMECRMISPQSRVLHLLLSKFVDYFAIYKYSLFIFLQRDYCRHNPQKSRRVKTTDIWDICAWCFKLTRRLLLLLLCFWSRPVSHDYRVF